MKAIRIHEFGGPEVLKYEDIPDPELRKDHVLIRVRACALNHLDLFVRQGLPCVKLPHIPGSDIAGEVVECGEYITDVDPGTRVLLSPMVFCNHCELCNTEIRTSVRNSGAGQQRRWRRLRAHRRAAGECHTDPRLFRLRPAASVPLVFLTAWHMLIGKANVRLGRTVLVLGAGSGVGSAAIQICEDAGRGR